MVPLGTIALVIGALSARQFNAAILIPISFAFFFSIVGYGVIDEASVGEIAIALVMSLTSTQLGYILGFNLWQSDRRSHQAVSSKLREGASERPTFRAQSQHVRLSEARSGDAPKSAGKVGWPETGRSLPR